MELVVREMSWFKRRVPTPKEKIIKAVVPDLKLEKDYFCNMYVLYESGEVKRYLSRVVQNHISKRWVIDGMHVVLDYKESV